MPFSRRGMIIDFLRQRKTDAEILAEVDKAFPPGTFSTSNAKALSGVKWDLRNTEEAPRQSPASSRRRKQIPSLNRSELVSKLRAFNAEPVIERYRQKLAKMTLTEILEFSVDKTIYRAFHTERQVNQEPPSLRYRRWRWHSAPELLLGDLDSLQDQDDLTCFALTVGESLVEDWGERNEHGVLTAMNIGVAMKITNLVFKHLSFSPHCHNRPGLIQWLHVPWDSSTLRPLRGWGGRKPIPNSPGQGFVDTLSLYCELHRFITKIAGEAGIHRITYEFWAYDQPRV